MSTCWPARWPGQPATSSTSVEADGVSRITSRTVAARQATMRSIPLVALLTPGVPAVVVSERLPEARLVVVEHLDPAHPLRALPEVQVRYQQARRPAVLGLERRAVVGVDHPRLAVRDVLDRQVGRVAAVGVDHRVGAEDLEILEQRVDRHALPAGAQLGPGRDAVDVDGDRLARQRLELLP